MHHEFKDFQVILLQQIDKEDPLYEYKNQLCGLKYINDTCPFDGDRWFPLKDTPELKEIRQKVYNDKRSFFLIKNTKQMVFTLMEKRVKR